MRKNKKFIILIIVIIICIILLGRKNKIFKDISNDILFFKYFQQERKEINDKTKMQEESNDKEIIKTNINQYLFKIKCKNTDFKNINLLETLNEETLINEKIAPGIEGMFDIVLNSNEDTQYKIVFQSQNQKPANLKFREMKSKKESSTLEELDTILTGELQKNQNKIITIQWYWEYENTKEGNMQDTIDSKNIEDYKFTIYATGEKVI